MEYKVPYSTLGIQGKIPNIRERHIIKTKKVSIGHRSLSLCQNRHILQNQGPLLFLLDENTQIYIAPFSGGALKLGSCFFASTSTQTIWRVLQTSLDCQPHLVLRHALLYFVFMALAKILIIGIK